MAKVVINTNAKSGGQPSAPLRIVKANVTGTDDYTTGGDTMAAAFPGQTVVDGPYVPTWDASELRWARLENLAGVVMLKFYDTSNGAPSTETTAADDCSGHTFDIWAVVE